MAKTHGRYVDISFGGTQVECSITGASGVGVTHEQTDITTLCNDIMETLQGTGDLNISFSGLLDNGASGAYTIIRPLADAGTLTAVNIDIGIGADPTTGNPRFAITNAIVFDYLVNPATGSAIADGWTIRGGEGVTAEWITVP